MIRQIVTKTSANSISAINSDSNFSISIKIGYDEKKNIKTFSSTVRDKMGSHPEFLLFLHQDRVLYACVSQKR